MVFDCLKNIFFQNKENIAFIFEDNFFSYEWLFDKINELEASLADYKNNIISIEGKYNPLSIALLIALIKNNNVLVPLTTNIQDKLNYYRNSAQVEIIIQVISLDSFIITNTNIKSEHILYNQLKSNNDSGLVLFTTGSSGNNKAALHSFSRLFNKYKSKRKNLSTIGFMLFDHIGGIDTIFYCLSNTSTIAFTNTRNPDEICNIIEKYKIEVLPVTPSFLNLLLISQSYNKYDLSSLKYVTYGTEPMPELTLKRCNEILPNVIFQQKYGLTELGTLISKSESNSSTWLKIDKSTHNIRINNNVLEIKSDSAMLGYLNAPSPFTKDGWYITRDLVETKGDFYRILGRESEIINVGGEKVFPSEIESAILEFEGIKDVIVYSEENKILGNIVCAYLSTINEINNEKEFLRNLKDFLKNKLENYKIPIKMKILSNELFNERFKKIRNKQIIEKL